MLPAKSQLSHSHFPALTSCLCHYWSRPITFSRTISINAAYFKSLILHPSPLQMPLSNLVHVLSRSCRCLLSIISIVRSIIWFRHPRRPGNTRIKAEFTDPTLRPASTNQQFSLHQCQTSSSLSTAQLDNFQSLFPFSHLQNSTPTPVGKFGWELQQRHPNSSFPGLLCVFNVCTRNKISAR